MNEREFHRVMNNGKDGTGWITLFIGVISIGLLWYALDRFSADYRDVKIRVERLEKSKK